MTKQKSVLSLASACSAGVMMQAWCCQSSEQGQSKMPRPACFIPTPPECSQELLPRRMRPRFALAPLYPEHNYKFCSGGVGVGGGVCRELVRGRGGRETSRELILSKLINIPTRRIMSPRVHRKGERSQGDLEKLAISVIQYF